MEKLKDQLDLSRRALGTLDEGLQIPFAVIVRDGCIQRFEYSFEATWKLLKSFLGEMEGIQCQSPKRCFREALAVGLLSDEETEACLRMTDDRNLTSRTYIESIAQTLYDHLPTYLAVMGALVGRIAARFDPPPP